MAYGSHGKPRTLHISLKGKSLAQLIILTSYRTYQILLTKSQCSKQKLTSCVISIILNLLEGFVQKMFLTKIRLSFVTSVNYGFLLNVTIFLFRLQVFSNGDEYWCFIECCSTIFLLNSLSSNKKFLACCTSTDGDITQQKDLENDHNSSLSLKPSLNLELLVKELGSATPENSNNLEKIILLNTMVLKKCITLKYVTKIIHYAHSKLTHAVLTKF